MNLSKEDFSPRWPEAVWSHGYKIPWDEPAFSHRMLAEHLSQEHDLASRRFEIVDRQTDWLHNQLLGGQNSKILDLGCGPGLYLSRLVALGHSGHGIDFSPASIEYAQQNNRHPERCSFVQGDLRTVEYGNGYDVAIMLYGEFNAFAESEIRDILKKTLESLVPGGRIILEVQTFDTVKMAGTAADSWYYSDSGLFSDAPHVCLTKSRWLELKAVAQSQFIVLDFEESQVQHYLNTLKAYREEELFELLGSLGYSEMRVLTERTTEQLQANDLFFLVEATRT